MPKIVPIVEGHGDVKAVPFLLRNLLEDKQRWEWQIDSPKRAGNLNNLRKRLSDFLKYAQREPDCRGILILLDLDEGCAKDEAHDLALEVKKLNLRCPTAIVFAVREYEAWFLASLNSIRGQGGLPEDLQYENDVEQIRGVKEWLTKQMPQGQAYKPTINQVPFTTRINIELARQKSRSFRRLIHAIEELLIMSENNQRGVVSPYFFKI